MQVATPVTRQQNNIVEKTMNIPVEWLSNVPTVMPNSKAHDQQNVDVAVSLLMEAVVLFIEAI